MANRQIEEYRGRDIQPLGQRARTRSLPTQVSAVTLQPVYFFRTLTDLQSTRQWLWIGIAILLLTGISAVQQQALSTGSAQTPGLGGGEVFPPDDLGGGFDRGFGGGGIDVGVPPDFGGPPVDGGTTTGGGTSGGLATTWTTALIAAFKTLLGWAVLTLLLCEVSLLNGVVPRFGHNFQIAVWASIPLGIMAALQLVYYAGGGTPRQPGLNGVLSDLPGYESMAPFFQSLLLSLTENLTVFWIWSLVLIYFGARFALHGKRWSSVLVVVIWVVVLVFTPVLTGAIAAPEPEPEGGLDMGIFPLGPEATPDLGGGDGLGDGTGFEFNGEGGEGEGQTEGGDPLIKPGGESIEGELPLTPEPEGEQIEGDTPVRPDKPEIRPTEAESESANDADESPVETPEAASP